MVEIFDVAVFGHGAISNEIINKLAGNRKKILCVTGSAQEQKKETISNIDWIDQDSVTLTRIQAKKTLVGWRKIPENLWFRNWFESSNFETTELFHLSSSSVYKDYPGRISEAHVAESFYNYESKKHKLEKYLQSISQVKSNPVSNLRISNAYGKTLQVGFIADILRAIREEKKIQVSQDLEILRDYIHISDIVSAVVDILYAELNLPVIHISTGIGTTILELLEAIELQGYRVEFSFNPDIQAVKSSVLQPGVLEDKFEWNPLILQRGIESIFSCIKRN